VARFLLPAGEKNTRLEDPKSERRRAVFPARPEEKQVGLSLMEQSTPRKNLWLMDKETGELLPFSSGDKRIRRMRRRIGSWTTCVAAEWNKEINLKIMITLTYRPAQGWDANHVREFMKHVKKYLGDRLIAYAWVAEMQKRGAVHYHILIVTKRGKMLPKPDQVGWWTYGSSNIEAAKKPGYIMKYAQKGTPEDENQFPAGLRLFAVIITSAFIYDECKRLIFRSSTLPSWIQTIYIEGGITSAAFPRKRKGGGWLIEKKFFDTPWQIRWMADSLKA